MNKLLKIQNLNIKIQNKQILKDLNLYIKEAQTLALVGQSGSGKTMLAYSVLNLYNQNKNFKTSGEIIYNNKNILSLNENDLTKLRGTDISMIFQEPMSALNPLHKVFKQIAEIITIHNIISKNKLEKKVYDLLEKVELHTNESLEKIANAYPHELSGGQRQRVMIAMAIANNPKLLIADEPTTALDVNIQFQILELLKKLQKEYKMAILLITHDIAVVKKYSDFIHVIKDGLILEKNNTKDLFLNPKHEYTKQLIQKNITFNDFEYKNLNKILQIKNMYVKFPITKGIFKKVVDNFVAVDNINIDLYEKECLGIIGQSGSGKSTLAQAILKLIKSSGDINFLNQDINKLNKKDLQKFRSNIQIVFQDPFNSLNPRMSIFLIISEGLDIHTSYTKEQKINLSIQILKEVNMSEDCLYKFPHEFSGGQRQRIAIARALILKPKLLILDEPTSALDRQVQFEFLNLLKNLQKKHNLTYIFISHDLEVIQTICNRVAVMKDGKIIEQNYTKDIFTNPKEKYTKELFVNR